MLLLVERAAKLEQLLGVIFRPSITLHLGVIVQILLAVVRGQDVRMHLLGFGVLVQPISHVFVACDFAIG